MATTGTLQATIDQILGTQTFGAAKNYLATSATSAYSTVSSTAASYTGGDTGSFFLSSLYYFLLYSFVLFLLLLLVHYTVRPVFSFVPGARGFFKVPTGTDDKVYINEKQQPQKDEMYPKDNTGSQGSKDDILASYDWKNNFTMSVDLYLRRPSETSQANRRVILYKSRRTTTTNSNLLDTSTVTGPTVNDNIIEYLKDKCSMAVYLDETNNLNVSFYTTAGSYNIAPIRNIPLYEPFRLTIVAEERLFTVYLNGRQTFQKVVPQGIAPPTYASGTNEPERFYPPPSWAENPKIAYLQNLHLWPRAISFAEVQTAQPALARKEDFDLPAEVDTGKCA